MKKILAMQQKVLENQTDSIINPDFLKANGINRAWVAEALGIQESMLSYHLRSPTEKSMLVKERARIFLIQHAERLSKILQK